MLWYVDLLVSERRCGGAPIGVISPGMLVQKQCRTRKVAVLGFFNYRAGGVLETRP